MKIYALIVGLTLASPLPALADSMTTVTPTGGSIYFEQHNDHFTTPIAQEWMGYQSMPGQTLVVFDSAEWYLGILEDVGYDFSGWRSELNPAYGVFGGGFLLSYAIDWQHVDTQPLVLTNTYGTYRVEHTGGPAPVPEPGTWVLMLTGLGVLWMTRKAVT